MEKTQKKANYKTVKGKKKLPLKVVYITNPIKFTTSASEFRALVQELTGQDAGTPYSAAVFSPEDGGGEGVKAAEERNAHAALDESEIAHFSSEVAEKEKPDPISDPKILGFGSFDDSFVSSLLMIESFHGLGSNLVEVLEV